MHSSDVDFKGARRKTFNRDRGAVMAVFIVIRLLTLHWTICIPSNAYVSIIEAVFVGAQSTVISRDTWNHMEASNKRSYGCHILI